MSESKHTPGQWDYVGDYIVGVVGDCDCPADAVKDSDTGVVYPERPHESHDIVPPVIEDDLPEGMTLETYIANCKLIAAAPDLLEALRDAHRWVGRLKDWEGAGDPDIDKWRAATAKATGEKS